MFSAIHVSRVEPSESAERVEKRLRLELLRGGAPEPGELVGRRFLVHHLMRVQCRLTFRCARMRVGCFAGSPPFSFPATMQHVRRLRRSAMAVAPTPIITGASALLCGGNV